MTMVLQKSFGLLTLYLMIIGLRVVRESLGVSLGVAAEATMALGFVLLFSFYAGRVASRLGLPAITGYIFSGLLFGPHILSQISPLLVVLESASVKELKALDGAALGLIALTAGGELKTSILRERARSISFIIAAHLGIVLVGVAAFFYLERSLFPSLAQLSSWPAIAAALLLGVTAVANSPATTIAVLQESNAKGPMSEIILAVTVAKDVVVVTVFTVVMALCLSMTRADGGAGDAGGHHFLLSLAWEVLGSFAAGALLGWLMTLYMRRVGSEVPLLVLAIAFLSGALGEAYHLSGLLVCIVAGFFVENTSEHGDDLIHAIERHALPLYIVFFTMTGASLDLLAIQKTWVMALALASVRMALTFAATAFGARLAGDPRAVQKHAWSGFLGQAGVTFGFAGIIARDFGSLGESLRTVIVAAVAFNQIFGPIIMRWSLVQSGEAQATDPDQSGTGGELDMGAISGEFEGVNLGLS